MKKNKVFDYSNKTHMSNPSGESRYQIQILVLHQCSLNRNQGISWVTQECGWIPGRSNKFSSSSNHPHWFGHPPSFLFSGCWRQCDWGMQLTAQQHLVRKLRMGGIEMYMRLQQDNVGLLVIFVICVFAFFSPAPFTWIIKTVL